MDCLPWACFCSLHDVFRPHWNEWLPGNYEKGFKYVKATVGYTWENAR